MDYRLFELESEPLLHISVFLSGFGLVLSLSFGFVPADCEPPELPPDCEPPELPPDCESPELPPDCESPELPPEFLLFSWVNIKCKVKLHIKRTWERKDYLPEDELPPFPFPPDFQLPSDCEFPLFLDSSFVLRDVESILGVVIL